MSKVYFIPDVHLQEYSPRNRKDNYPTVILEKLDWIVDYVNKNNGVAIFLGDVFNATNMPLIYLYRVIDTFKKFKDVPYVIQGNHDIPRNNSELVDRTPLGLMENTGIIKWLQELDIDNVHIKGFHYPQDIVANDNKDKVSICAAHVFYENGFAQDHNLTKDMCNELGYNYYILGHDHSVYDDVVLANSKVIRPGSISRGTANENQLIRDMVHIIEYDTTTNTIIKVPISCCKPATEVFKDSVFLRKEEDKIDTKEVLDNLVFTSNDNIYDVLDKADQPQEIKDIVETYLQGAGIYRVTK